MLTNGPTLFLGSPNISTCSTVILLTSRITKISELHSVLLWFFVVVKIRNVASILKGEDLTPKILDKKGESSKSVGWGGGGRNRVHSILQF